MTEQTNTIVWVKDKKGNDHVCYIHDSDNVDKKRFEQLTENEQSGCYSKEIRWV